jgi:hypothetical protein
MDSKDGRYELVYNRAEYRPGRIVEISPFLKSKK